MLHKYGMANPMTGLHEKVIGYQLGEKIEVRDPYTMKKDKKPLKPFMVNNSVIIFERHKIIMNPKDKKYREQFEQYRIESVSKLGIPVYSDKNEHMIDATNLALLVFEQKYGELFRQIVSSRIMVINGLTKEDKEMNRRASEDKNIMLKNGYLKITGAKKENEDKFGRNQLAGRSTRKMPRRSNF